MFRQVLLLVLLLAMLPLAFAQPQSKEELKFREKQATELNKYADKAYKEGFPNNAKKVYLMLLSEYDPDNANAREKLGYQRSGKTWIMTPGFVYPKSDSPDAAAAESLKKSWASTSAKLASAHKKMAEEYEKAGRTDLSTQHWEKVMRFAADDEDAQKALNHEPVEGLSGTGLEKTLFDRSKLIMAVVEEESRKDYEVELLGEGQKHILLEKAKLKYFAVRSEHFTLYGDFKVGEEWNTDLLVKAAKDAERSLRVMQRVFAGYDGFNDDPERWINDWAFFMDGETYKQVLEANKDLMDQKSFEFRRDHTSGSMLIDQANRVGLEISSPSNERGVYDGAVRNVAQSYSGFRSSALVEGIGHTIVGMFFNNNLSFVVDKKTQLESTTGEEDVDRFSPNMDTWKDLALEAAWKLGEGTPAAGLPLITADKFPDDARIKSWSFCDYMVRRDPTLLLDLDKLTEFRQPVEVEAKFTSDHDGLSIAQLEKEWKDFWTGASPVLKAINDNTEPLSALNKDAALWLREFNKARKEGQASTVVTWSEAYSGRCAEHVRYLIAHPDQRGAGPEQMQDVNLEGGSHLGDMFAHMAIVDTDAKKPKDVFKRWLDYPGYRDALLNNSLRTIGLYHEDDILVMDVIRGLGKPEAGKAGMGFYPGNGDDIPTSIAVADLGPEVVDLLEKHGHGGKTVIGYPISLHHFGGGGVAGMRESYRCSLMQRDEVIAGIVHLADGGENRRTSAPGMVVFYPLEPLPKGKEFKLKWVWETDKLVLDKEITFDT